MFKNIQKRFTLAALAAKTKRFLLVGLAVLWMTYSVATNHAANQFFAIDSASNELKNLQHQLLLLNVQASELQSIERIENASKSLSLVQTSEVYYLVDQQEVVARK